MNEPIDFEGLSAALVHDREDRVVRAVLDRIAGRSQPAGGLTAAILGASRIALPACIVAALLAVIGARGPSGIAPSNMSAARALGVPLAIEQLIRQPEPPSIDEMLNAFGGRR